MLLDRTVPGQMVSTFQILLSGRITDLLPPSLAVSNKNRPVNSRACGSTPVGTSHIVNSAFAIDSQVGDRLAPSCISMASFHDF